MTELNKYYYHYTSSISAVIGLSIHSTASYPCLTSLCLDCGFPTCGLQSVRSPPVSIMWPTPTCVNYVQTIKITQQVMQLGLLVIITVHMWPMNKPTITAVAHHKKKKLV